MKNWYVLFVKTGDEVKAVNALCREGLDAFMMTMEVVHRKEGKSFLVKKNMFPGYLFVESDLEQVDFWLLLKSLSSRVSYFMKLLTFDNEGTSALYPHEKEYLESLLNDKRVMEHSIGFIEGNQVIITDGPLMGYESKIVKIDRHKRRALLEIDFIGEIRHVNVSLEIISKK